MDILVNKLNVPVSDNVIEVAHRAGQVNSDKPRSIIVRFHRRDTKYNVMKLRKHLRGTGVSISEDLTKRNLVMMNDLKHHPRIEDTWAWNGKIFAKGTNGKSFVVRYGQNIDDELNNDNKGE